MQKGEPNLTDFGLARLVELKAVSRTLEVIGHAQLHGARTSSGK